MFVDEHLKALIHFVLFYFGKDACESGEKLKTNTLVFVFRHFSRQQAVPFHTIKGS